MKKILLWILAIAVTVAAALYQRTTGPTYPKSVEVAIGDSTYELELIRTSGERNARVKLPMMDTALHATLVYKKFKVQEEWTQVPFEFKMVRYHSWFMKKVLGKEDGIVFSAFLPQQPPAGKLEYFIIMEKEGETQYVAKERPIVIRFKGDVPASVLIPHILLMFFTMLLSILAALYAIFKIERYRRYTIWTFVILFIGGFIFGPWVQWHAFGEWWTGIPFGWDLTDNKTLFAFVFWLAAVIGNLRKGRPWLVILAAVMTMVIFSIPHSLFGSELNYTSGTIGQG